MSQVETVSIESSSRLLLPSVQAVVLCGGLGMRLRGRVPGVPKALAPIGGRPFLEYLLNDLVAAGFRDVLLCTGYRSDEIHGRFGDGARFGARIEYSEETESLGTAGALKHAERKIRGEAFFLLNGDTLFAINYRRLLDRHRQSGAIATLALAYVENGARYGNVMVGSDGRVLSLREKPDASADSGNAGAWIYGGICVVERRLLAAIPSVPPAISLEREILPRFVGRGLFAERCDGFFLDIGIPEDYERACTLIPQRCACAGSHSC